MTQVLVTGGAGFIGSHVVDALVAAGFEPRILDRRRSAYHRRDAVWPFTVVGRPPQEDTTFGQLIHELTGPVIPTVLPGVRGTTVIAFTNLP